MKIEFNVELQDKVFEGKNYSSEYMTINLTEGNDSTYNVYVYGSANYINATEFVESVKGAVNALSLDYPTAFGISQDGEPVICSKSDEVVLLNVSFNDVYYNYKDDSLTSYSEVFYNRSIGIIGFRDKNDLLWVFARFEE
ncbi:MAG TPA: hypothetical protein ENJ28_10935 [Gammaproteobacteria bacterium]|nr:hypothetical protein [Gammaproteobacteria bacterium]